MIANSFADLPYRIQNIKFAFSSCEKDTYTYNALLPFNYKYKCVVTINDLNGNYFNAVESLKSLYDSATLKLYKKRDNNSLELIAEHYDN